MKTETRTCQNCKNKFTIEPDDFAFYLPAMLRIALQAGERIGT